MSSWRFAGESLKPKGPIPDSETISLEGLNPWRYSWNALKGPAIAVPDPQDVSRRRHVRLYEIRGNGVDLKFAAGIFGDFWQFYIPALEDAVGAFEASVVKYEGYWRNSKEEVSELPWPTPERSWTGRLAFLALLESAEANAERVAYRGISLCRICRCKNGNAALQLENWDWPSGYKHYLVDHDVRPSADFEKFILGRSAETTGPL